MNIEQVRIERGIQLGSQTNEDPNIVKYQYCQVFRSIPWATTGVKQVAHLRANNGPVVEGIVIVKYLQSWFVPSDEVVEVTQTLLRGDRTA